MLHKISRLALVILLSLAAWQPVAAESGESASQGIAQDEQQPVKPTGPAAKKANELIRGYTARIEKEIEQDRKELERLRVELKELIDLRYDMATVIAEIRGDLAAKGTYSGEPVIVQGQSDTQDRKTTPPQQGPVQGITFRRDFFYGLGSALPKEPSPEQLEQLRRLAPRADLKRMIKGLRAEVEETRTEVDQLAYRLLELRAGIVSSNRGFGGMGGMGVQMGPSFGSLGSQGGMGMR